MAGKEYLRQTLEHYRQQRQSQLEELRKTEIMVSHLEKELGESPTVEVGPTAGVEFLNLAADIRPSEPRTVGRPDEFYGMTQTQAAKAYLQRIKMAVSIDQIVEALRNGGANLGGADPKKTLYVSLARNPERQFVIPKEGYFGLREFYPNLPKTVSKPKGSKNKKPPKVRHKAGAKKHKAASVLNDSKEKPVKASVRKILGDGGMHSLEQIQASVEKELGRKVARLGIAATLRGKEFIKEAESYKLAKE